MGFERELVALLRLLADREEVNGGVAHIEHLLREHRTHVAELDEVLGTRVRVRPGVDQHGRAVTPRDHDRDAGAMHAGEAADVQEGCGKHRAGVARRDDSRGLAVPHGPHRADE